MQEIDFGRIEGLLVCGGEPVFEPPPRLVHTVRMRARNRARPEAELVDFTLKEEVAQLFGHLTGIGNGIIRRIEVRHGLPQSMEIERQARP